MIAAVAQHDAPGEVVDRCERLGRVELGDRPPSRDRRARPACRRRAPRCRGSRRRSWSPVSPRSARSTCGGVDRLDQDRARRLAPPGRRRRASCRPRRRARSYASGSSTTRRDVERISRSAPTRYVSPVSPRPSSTQLLVAGHHPVDGLDRDLQGQHADDLVRRRRSATPPSRSAPRTTAGSARSR